MAALDLLNAHLEIQRLVADLVADGRLDPAGGVEVLSAASRLLDVTASLLEAAGQGRRQRRPHPASAPPVAPGATTPGPC